MTAGAAPWPFRVVADTNVYIAAVHRQKAEKRRQDGYQTPPSEEFIIRAVNDEFLLLFSLSGFLELAEKLEQLGVETELAQQLLEDLRAIAEEVITATSSPFCDDRDDDKFVWASIDGRASHLITEDRGLTRGATGRGFRVVQVVGFLRALRAERKARGQQA